MGLFSRLTGKLSKHTGDKRAHKSAGKHHSHRSEYLLNEDTPFDVTEAFRNLKAALSVSVPKKDGGVAIMTTSAYPEDGKTTVTVNLALMFAISDAKVSSLTRISVRAESQNISNANLPLVFPTVFLVRIPWTRLFTNPTSTKIFRISPAVRTPRSPTSFWKATR